MKSALVDSSNIVIAVDPITVREDGYISNRCFHSKANATMVSVPDEVKVGYSLVDSAWTPPQRPLAEVKTEKLAALAQKARAIESQNVLVAGNQIGTDTTTISRITAAISVMGRKPTATIPFFLPQTGWGNATKAELEAMQDAIWDHIKATLDNEKLHYDAIEALTTSVDVESYDFSPGWPG